MTYTYTSDGLRRLRSEYDDQGGSTAWYTDVFGNRVKEVRPSSADSLNNDPGDNRLLWRRNGLSGTSKQAHWYWYDRNGNRIGSTDTTGTSVIRETRMTYTAANQLAWSLTHNVPGSYSHLAATATWHWYDAQGLRVMTEVASTGLSTYPALGPGSGTRTYYFYDGADVALTLYQAPTQPVKVAKRYLTGGLDRQLAVRIYTTESGYVGSLALISNRQGTGLGAMRPNGLRETSVTSYGTDAFGKVAGADGDGTTNPEVGFAGASTGDPQGGFTYLRNRWYDPQTGRFLTQDPIGLAGGVNLYAYAGNNPVSFSDPYGLCVPMPICLLGPTVARAAPVAVSGPVGLAVGATALLVMAIPEGEYVGPPSIEAQADATAVGTGATVFLTQQAHWTDKTNAQLNVALQHITQIEGLGPNDEDPEGKKRDWTKHAKKALNNARKFVEKVRGKTQDALKRAIDEAAERLQQGQ